MTLLRLTACKHEERAKDTKMLRCMFSMSDFRIMRGRFGGGTLNALTLQVGIVSAATSTLVAVELTWAKVQLNNMTLDRAKTVLP